MTINTFDIHNSNAPMPTQFRVTDAQSYAVEFNAQTLKEFEVEIKKIALSSIPKHSYIKEIQVQDYAGNWLNFGGFVKRFGNGIALDLTKVDFEQYHNKLVTKAKGAWAIKHCSLTPKEKTQLKLVDNE